MVVLACLLLHVAAPLAMVTLLWPGLDMEVPLLERAHFVGEHAARWRLGWLPWQLTALSDIGLSLALLAYARAVSLPWARPLALAGVVVTLLALVPDQGAEAQEVTVLLSLARAQPVDLAAFGALEARLLLLTGTCATILYALMGLLWSLTAVALGGSLRHRAFLAVGGVIWLVFAAAAIVNAHATTHAGYPGFALNGVLNAVGFALLAPWLAWLVVVIGDGHHERCPAHDAAAQALRWPNTHATRSTRAAARCLSALAAAPGARDLARLALPLPGLKSDIVDVVVLNWLVPTARVAHLVSRSMRLRSFGDRTPLSILTYRHGAFGPQLLGPLRSLLPSPHQSNWRLYLEDAGAIYLLGTCLDSAAHVLGSRLLSDGLPAHLATMVHARAGRRIETRIDPHGGSAPDLHSIVDESERVLPAEFAAHFHSWDEAVRFLVEQDRAVRVLPALGGTVESLICIPIPLTAVVPARVVQCESLLLADIVEGCESLGFIVPRMDFRALGERWA